MTEGPDEAYDRYRQECLDAGICHLCEGISGPKGCPLCYGELQEKHDELLDLVRELAQWFEAYPVDIFTPLQGDPIKKTGDYDTPEKRNLITRASAAMARHMIERIPEKIRKAIHE